MSSKGARAIRYHDFGKPEDVLLLEEVALPETGREEVLVRMLASPINPADIGSILGKYGKLKELPATAGMEGIGEILETGSEVKHLKAGQWVRIPEETGAWQERCVLSAEPLRPLPEGLPVESACMAAINPPTAIRLLEDYGPLAEGDWIIQNGANSNVGIAVIQYAKKIGLRTVNVVRREALKRPLLDLGADVVLTEEEPYARNIGDFTGGRNPKLALNSIGGESALRLLDTLGPGGTHVTFGGMTFEPVRFPTRQLIFNDVRLCGFWLMLWRRSHSPEEVLALDDLVYDCIGEGTFRFPVEAKYQLEEFKKALRHTKEPRLGKVLLTG